MGGFTRRFVLGGRTRRHGLATSSTVARWELAHRIKVRRHQLGISVDQIAKHLGFTRNFFSAVENERSMLATDKLEVLLVVLDFEDQEREELLALNEAARDRGWWESKEIVDLIGESGSRLFGLEQGASRIRSFESVTISGLFQTAEFTRTMLSVDPKNSPVQISRLVEARQRRQADVRRRGVPITAVIGEAGLRQRWSDNELHLAQLQHILDLAAANPYEIRVLPFDSAPGVVVAASTLELLDFPSAHLPTVAYQEAIRDLGVLKDGEAEFEQLRLAWEDGFNRSLLPDASMDFIANVISDG